MKSIIKEIHDKTEQCEVLIPGCKGRINISDSMYVNRMFSCKHCGEIIVRAKSIIMSHHTGDMIEIDDDIEMSAFDVMYKYGIWRLLS